MTSSASTARDIFMPRPPAEFGRGLAWAVLAHLLLVAALSFGVSWRVSQPEGIEAELWAAVPQQAAPRAVEPPPPPPQPPEPRPEPKVEPKAEPVKPPPPEPDAQIAIEKARKKKELADAQAEKAREAEKLAEQKRKDEAADKRREELDKKKREAAQAAALAKARDDQMKRMAALAGATGAPTATGSALQSASMSPSYQGRIKARIRPNVSFPDTLPGNPTVEVEIRLAPDGRILSSRIVKPSGVPEWDEAVFRAIERTEVLPRNEEGKVPPSFVLQYKLRD